jgi:ubiquinone/menaquinone biosynthesis C-methylase UbiE
MTKEFELARDLHNKIPEGYQRETLFKGNNVQKFWNIHKFIKIKPFLPKTGVILDIGCGSGSLGTLRKKLDLTHVQICGIDLSLKQLIYAKKHQPENFFVEASGHQLPFKDNIFDAVTIIELIEHIPELEISSLIKETYRVLKPNGKIIITTPNYNGPYILLEKAMSFFGKVNYNEQHITHFSPSKMKILMKKQGFGSNVFTGYGFAPFLAAISPRFAKKVLNIEDKYLYDYGLKLFCIGKKDE